MIILLANQYLYGSVLMGINDGIKHWVRWDRVFSTVDGPGIEYLIFLYFIFVCYFWQGNYLSKKKETKKPKKVIILPCLFHLILLLVIIMKKKFTSPKQLHIKNKA